MNKPQKINLITSFPDFQEEGFNLERYNQQFKDANVIIAAVSCDVSYPEHWGPLSMKCSLSGKENYIINRCRYTVDEKNYLLLNEGQFYSSYIYSKEPVHSFTISFSKAFCKETIAAILDSTQNNIDDPWHYCLLSTGFIEKLYAHDRCTENLIRQLKVLSENFSSNQHLIEELFYKLLERLVLTQKDVQKEINKIEAVKTSTRLELYKRLARAKDYMDSCFMEDVSLDKLSAIAHLNTAYLIRHFKKYFNLTPVQYLIQKRTSVAKSLLEETSMPVSEICGVVGYSDLTSFSKLFKSFYHSSPNQYRFHKQQKKYQHGDQINFYH